MKQHAVGAWLASVGALASLAACFEAMYGYGQGSVASSSSAGAVASVAAWFEAIGDGKARASSCHAQLVLGVHIAVARSAPMFITRCVMGIGAWIPWKDFGLSAWIKYVSDMKGLEDDMKMLSNGINQRKVGCRLVVCRWDESWEFDVDLEMIGGGTTF
ncbi:uncharacterized protein MELLADRAFT_112532 [Melampsora larici-populina 98AG31]|uniref:Secreted protein n=1 Tax=Melampsora larici-populina (strain 98AG31 / pathotype 3-4-7) TaxID=747676 RepID=F4S6S7_MELLP|nr:uncharacterized protein MELLADRAFT_112532 [Melampsora larici-populina 98AG31]EGF99621.1 hypothetical protein MELLADRAFT_112532 [Melampsora larici-populina 98AG31]